MGFTLACRSCRTSLMRYSIRKPRPDLLKLHPGRIERDFTDGKGDCHECGQPFARLYFAPDGLTWRLIRGATFFHRQVQRPNE
ncbi:Uncharacterized protein PBTT_06689 [Plasmodiophora brassicae]|uniref:Uncharacterized protein n=1 Tax=Plasmodiophora brassicae TaxID=37360 RepID=A0A0G4IW65_PLABS|nr:hypothetical protein PBRA_001280 [Plasmodiophora brassicae]